MSAYKMPLPLIRLGGWRARAACTTRLDETLWDDQVDGETNEQRDARHATAKAICGHCPVRKECGDDVDPKYDDGVRGGHVLPPLRTQHTDQEAELIRLLKKGWPLDEAVRGSRRRERLSEAS